MNTLEVLEKLSNAFGPPGGEDPTREAIVENLRGHVDEMRVDALGNLITLKRGTGRYPLKIMLAAHMDEVGLMIMGVEPDGTLRFRVAGGIDERVLLGKVVLVGPDRILGVIGLKPIHLLRGNERSAVVKTDALRIDIGAENKEAAARLAQPGQHAVFATQFGPLGIPAAGEQGHVLVKGKALDDRAGCTVLIELLRGEPYPYDVYGVFTTQEEIGSRGARVAAHAIQPQAAFALEGTTANDLPQEEDEDVSPSTTLGHGPAITVMDRSLLADRRLNDHLIATAGALGIRYQFKQPGTGGTDAGSIHLVGEGIPSTVVSVPCRYIHSPVAILDVDDLENAVKLVRGALDRLTPDVLAQA
jgi:putative aminopeptidase FrvX